MFVGREVGGHNRLVHQAGYTKAVDIWSLGCLTTELFLGHSYFANTLSEKNVHKSSEAIRTKANECDLSRLDHGFEWRGVDARVKDFIKICLNLDEKRRPTTKEALVHRWFLADHARESCHRHYEEFTMNWEPTIPIIDYTEDLRLAIEHTIPKNDVGLPFANSATADICGKTRNRLLSWYNQEKKEDHSSSSLFSNSHPHTTSQRGKAQGPGYTGKLGNFVRTSSIVERLEGFAFDSAANKRRRSFSDDEDHAIRKAVWEDNRGFVSAKTYATKIGHFRRAKMEKKA